MTDSMINGLVQAAYIVAAVLFIAALAGLSKHESAKAGNLAGMVGMLIALAATITLALRTTERGIGLTALLIAVPMAVGAVIGF